MHVRLPGHAVSSTLAQPPLLQHLMLTTPFAGMGSQPHTSLSLHSARCISPMQTLKGCMVLGSTYPHRIAPCPSALMPPWFHVPRQVLRGRAV